MNKFGELRVDVGGQVFGGGIAADDDFCVNFNKVSLHGLTAAATTVAKCTHEVLLLIPPVIVFGITWLLGMLAVTIYLTALGGAS